VLGPEVGAAPSITAIVADPTDGTGATAWFVSRNWGGTANGLWKATGSGSLNVTAYYVEGPGTDLAFGSDNLIYLAQYGLHQIQVFNPATGESVATVPLAGECQRPKYIRRGPTGSQELWFIADDVITPIVNICKITETGSPRSVSVVASNTSARGLCVGPDGYVWYNVPDGGTSSGGNVVRLEGTPATHWSFDVGSGSVNASRYIACGGGAVWSSNFTRIARVVP